MVVWKDTGYIWIPNWNWTSGIWSHWIIRSSWISFLSLGMQFQWTKGISVVIGPPISNLLRFVPYSSIVIPIPSLVHLKPRFLGVLKGLEGMNISNCSQSRSHQDRDAVYLAVKECGPVQRVSGEASAEALQLVQQLLSKVILDKRWTKTWICDPFPTTQK